MIYNFIEGDPAEFSVDCQYNDTTGELYMRVFAKGECIFSEPAPIRDNRACKMARVLVGDKYPD